MFDKYLDNYKNEIVSKICDLINIPSVSIETSDSSIPFGIDCKKALDYILNLGNSLGFRTKNIDDYCGYIEFGSGEKLIGIIGHLDVVPSGDGWISPPFQASIRDNKIYGRGAIDDKGPVIASLYAMKAVMDNCSLNSRVRLIVGLNEEKDWKCINHYKEFEEYPSIGFSPDADFPCIYAEKGIATIYIKSNLNNDSNSIKIEAINCNNNAINVVPKYCEVVLSINNTTISAQKLTEEIITFTNKFNFNIDCILENSTKLKLISHGVQAHAAHPDLGKNAISPMIILLDYIYKTFDNNVNLFDFFSKYINTEFNGNSLGINVSDESGNLTLNVGDFSLNNNALNIGLNLRIPCNTSINYIYSIIKENANHFSLDCELKGIQEPLFISKEDKLVQTLLNIYNRKTNSNTSPIAIGGGTYARAFKNCISFGANFPGDTDMCHQANEFIDIDKLLLASKIYADAIYELDKMNP